jgi:tetraacyldisaccharide-1-P 4'-kinase
VHEEKLCEIKKSFLGHKIFTGRHAVHKVYPAHGAKRMLAVAGIGSFSGFLSSIKQTGIELGGTCEYPDHYRYAKQDVVALCVKMKRLGCDGIITTEKDWQKLKFLVGDNFDKFFILEIAFEFLSKKQEHDFLSLIN